MDCLDQTLRHAVAQTLDEKPPPASVDHRNIYRYARVKGAIRIRQAPGRKTMSATARMRIAGSSDLRVG